MSKDIDCPYCGEGQDICHDDGYGYEDGADHKQDCGDCGREFKYTTEMSFHYEVQCSGEHDYEPRVWFGSKPNTYPDAIECKLCEHISWGERVEAEEEPK